MLRKRLMRSVQRLIGSSPEVDEAIIVERPTKLWPDALALTMPMIALGVFTSWSLWLVAGCGIVVAGVVHVVRRRYFIIAGAGDQLIICRSTKLNPEAAEVLVTLPRTTPIRWIESSAVDIIVIDGQRYGMSRAFRSRLDAIGPRRVG